MHAGAWLLPPSNLLGTGALHEQEFRVEFCHVTPLLVRHLPSLHKSLKREVIEFGWTSIRFDDITVTRAAYLFIARSLLEYKSPAEIVVLRARPPEARSLVREHLETLAPPRGCPLDRRLCPIQFLVGRS